jgi:hypothetical protein
MEWNCSGFPLWAESVRVFDVRVRADRGGLRLPEGGALVTGVAVANARHLLENVVLLSCVLRRWPWLVPCVTVTFDEPETMRGLGRLVEWAPRAALCRVSSPTCVPAIEAIRRAISQRPAPDAAALAGYVCARLRTRALKDALLEQFAHVRDGRTPTKAASSYSRAFAKRGRFSARDWRAVAMLVWHAAPGASRTVMSPVTEQRTGRRYLGTSPSTLRSDLIAWEHVVELALRVGGYVTNRAVRCSRQRLGVGAQPGCWLTAGMG